MADSWISGETEEKERDFRGILGMHVNVCKGIRARYHGRPRYVGLDLPPTSWLGTSVDEQKRVRIAENAFREISGVAVKWLSLEPLREPLEFTDLSMFDWIVIGAQTETRQPGRVIPPFAPPFEWVSRIVAQAREAGCRVHLKPNLLGAVNPQLPGMQMPDEYPEPQHAAADVQDGLFERGALWSGDASTRTWPMTRACSGPSTVTALAGC